MKVIVCGGRDFQSPAQVWQGLDRLHEATPITQLMQGGATGVDTFAKEWAVKHPGIQRFVCRADWDKHGRAAGPIRNARMLEWGPDAVVAFPGGRGTANMVKQATEAGVRVIHLPDDPNEAYEVAAQPPGTFMSEHGWWICRRNGEPQWYGPEDRMRELATNHGARIEARRSKMHHDRKPT